MQFSKKRFLFPLIALCLAGAVAELGLHLLCSLSPRVSSLLAPPWYAPVVAPTVPDAQLGHRPNPEFPSHDDNGFRNADVPRASYAVALGDSQTYGTGVEREDAWPYQLETLIGQRVYNMAYGGYGPAHSLLLWNQASAMQPAVVIKAFYAGNDLYDSFDLVLNRGQLQNLMNTNAEQMDAVLRAERAYPIAKRVRDVSDGILGALPSAYSTSSERVGNNRSCLRAWLSTHSAMYGLIRRTRYELARLLTPSSEQEGDQKGSQTSFAKNSSAYSQVFSNGYSRTVFTPEYRLSALDLGDPRIAEGLRISLLAIEEMQRRATEIGIRFIVLLIPTKESVYSHEAADFESASYHDLIRWETEFRERVKEFLGKRGIEYVDILPDLQMQLSTGTQPYRETRDGHPNEQGHRVIAAAMERYLKGTESR